MAFHEKTQSGERATEKGGLDRTNPKTPSGVTPGQGQTEVNANKPDDQELDEQGKATGQMSSQKESNRMAGTTSSANSGNRDSTGGTSGPKY